MTVAASDILFVHAEDHPMDVFSREGGYHTSQQVSDLVDSLFQPGIILDSDASDSYTYQYRKCFLKNFNTDSLSGVKVYGFNNKATNYVKFALERDIGGNLKIDGSEVIATYRTTPTFTTDTCFTEIADSSNAQQIGNNGILSETRAQGIWLRMKLPKSIEDIATDEFCLGVSWT